IHALRRLVIGAGRIVSGRRAAKGDFGHERDSVYSADGDQRLWLRPGTEHFGSAAGENSQRSGQDRPAIRRHTGSRQGGVPVLQRSSAGRRFAPVGTIRVSRALSQPATGVSAQGERGGSSSGCELPARICASVAEVIRESGVAFYVAA